MEHIRVTVPLPFHAKTLLQVFIKARQKRKGIYGKGVEKEKITWASCVVFGPFYEHQNGQVSKEEEQENHLR